MCFDKQWRLVIDLLDFFLLLLGRRISQKKKQDWSGKILTRNSLFWSQGIERWKKVLEIFYRQVLISVLLLIGSSNKFKTISREILKTFCFILICFDGGSWVFWNLKLSIWNLLNTNKAAPFWILWNRLVLEGPLFRLM